MGYNMHKMPGPASTLLVGATFICLFTILSAASTDNPSNLPDLPLELKKSQSLSMDHSLQSYNLPLKNDNNDLSLPTASRGASGLQLGSSLLACRALPSKEEIVLNESHSSEQLSDLKAVNKVAQRDVKCDTYQDNGETKSFANSLDVSVTGFDQKNNRWHGIDWEIDSIEKRVDDALDRSMKNDQNSLHNPEQYPKSNQASNNMDIDVSGITVSAINTVKGGSAVATSNIVIKPVQIITCPSEVDEKLK